MDAKAVLSGIGGFGIFLVMLLVSITLGVVFVFGSLWAGTHLLPFLSALSGILFVIVIFVLLPLAIPRSTRGFSSVAIFGISYVFGATLWIEGLLLTYFVWGIGAVFIGLFMVGIGVVPIAMLATLVKGMWGLFIELVLMTVATFACRIGAMKLAET